MKDSTKIWETIKFSLRFFIYWFILFPIVAMIGLMILLLILFLLTNAVFYWEHTSIELHVQNYYLQQEICFGWEREHHLYYKVDEEKKLILPQVYGYEETGKFLYVGSIGGYAIVDLDSGTANIISLSKDVPIIENSAITYGYDLSDLDAETQKRLVNLSHKINAYFVDKENDKTIGDGRFQCMFLADDEDVYQYSLEAYDLRIGGWHDTLLPSLNGCRINEKSQMMYVTSPHGYAVIDGLSGTCRVLLTNRDAAPPDYQKDIQVLDSFEDFTPEEQAILLEVEKEGFK